MAGVGTAKPARKLKNAADEVAQGNLRQHPELESGPQEFPPPELALTRWSARLIG